MENAVQLVFLSLPVRKESASMATIAAPPPLDVLESAEIRPSPSPSPAILPLTCFDLIWIFSPPVDRLFIFPYPHPLPHFLSSSLPALKSSLAHTLADFLPLAGRLHRNSDTGRYEIAVAHGDGVTLTVAVSHADFDAVAGEQPREVAALSPLIPRLEALDKLLAVQVTVFPNRGMAFAVAVHHSCCDGNGSTHFLHSWAARCRLAGAPAAIAPPVLDRTLFKDTDDLYGIFEADMLKPEDFAMSTCRSPQDAAAVGIVFATFTLTPEHIRLLKDAVNASLKANGLSPWYCSTVVAAVGLFWFCRIRAKAAEPASPAGGEVWPMLMPVDLRARLDPPLPDKYFGSAVGAYIIEAPASAFAGDDTGACVVAVCEAVGGAIEQCNKYHDMKTMRKRVKATVPLMPVTVAGSPKFNVYGIDFGWGAPARVDIMSVATTGALALSDSRAGGGAVEVGIALGKEEMARFAGWFAAGIASLQSSSKKTCTARSTDQH